MRSRKLTSEQAGSLTSSIINIRSHLFRSLIGFFALTCLAISLSSCAALLKSSLKKPVIRIISLRVERGKNTDPTYVPLIVTLAVKNENSFTIETRRISYLILSGRRVLARGKGKNLPALGEGEEVMVRLPLSVSTMELLHTVQTIFKRKKIELTVRGAAAFATPIGDVTIPFEKRFEKDLKEFIRFH